MIAVVFDFDNTLYNYDSAHLEGIRSVSVYFKRVFNISSDAFIEFYEEAKYIVKEQLGDTAASHNKMFYFKNILYKLGYKSIEYIEEIDNIYWNSFHKSMSLYPWVIPVFDYIKSNNIKIGLCTNYMLSEQLDKIRILGIGMYFDAIVSSEEVGLDKPHLPIYKQIAYDLSLNYENILFIGDDYLRDYLIPVELGMKALHLDNHLNIANRIINLIKELG